MTNRTLKTGDRIIGISRQDEVDITDMIGVVLSSLTRNLYPIQFDSARTPFHSCSNRSTPSYCYWVEPKNLRPYTPKDPDDSIRKCSSINRKLKK